MRALLSFLFLFALCLPSNASSPPSPAPVSIFGAAASLAVASSSSQAALPISTTLYPVVELVNDGPVEVFIALGTGGAVVATTATGIPVQAGRSRALWIGSNTNVAAITAAGASTLRILQWNGAPNYSGSSDYTTASILPPGSTGTDYSGGSVAGGSGAGTSSAIPVSGFVLLTTIPATSTRAFVEVQNQSAGTIQLVRDDGAGGNLTTILLGPGSGAGAQGAGWTSGTFKGRIRLYGASGAQVSASQD